MLSPNSKSMPRRHDLDALRAFAMLLGIALHAALSFMPVGWMIQDSQRHELFGIFIAAIHGFRMPVFFVMSGFFTAMLWRRRGLQSLLHHRFQRIFLPLLLGLLTVVPAVEWVSRWSIGLGPTETSSGSTDEASESDEDSDLEALVAMGPEELDATTGLTALSLAAAGERPHHVQHLLEAGASPDTLNKDGSSPLILAAVFGRVEAARLLIEAGADLQVQSGDGSTALHTAAFFGRAEIVRALLEKGADTTVRNAYGQIPSEVLAADWGTTAFIAQMVGVTLDQETLEAGRAEIAKLFADDGPAATASPPPSVASRWQSLSQTPFFHHLWFLWFLCWLVAGFAVYASCADRLGWRAPAWISVSSLRLLWLVPITALPQFFMGRLMPVFGADTSSGLLPLPHVLAYYAIFFAYGALYFDADDEDGRVGRWWLVHLPLSLLVLFPVGLGFAFGGIDTSATGLQALSALVQATYPWLMTFGLMGAFRRLLSRESVLLRYISDASYWLYLTHLPLVMVAQAWVRDSPWPGLLKFSLICLVITGFLLVIYQVAVRYSWLGRLLNGPRQRPGTPLVEAPLETSPAES